jgi:hypothetical protein
MTLVWEHSSQDGNALLLMLALADFADDHGVAFPSVERLAKKSRMSERNAHYVIKGLVEAGELSVERGAGGRKGTNRYQILVNPTIPMFELEQGAILAWGAIPAGGAKSSLGGARERRKGVQPVAPEPSLTVSKNRQVAGQAPASPVSACWQVYSKGIKAAYGAEYPPSAQANGQLNHVVKKLGSGPAIQVVAHYLANKKPYYVARKHALEVLVRDCATLWLECQQAAGGRAAQPCAYCPTAAIGSVNGIDHCRAHQNDAMDAKRVAA